MVWGPVLVSQQHSQGKTKFYSIHYKYGCLATSDLLMFLHNQLSSIRSIIKYEEYRCLNNVIHQIDSKNEWLLLSASFTAKFGLVFVLTMENTFS